VPQGKMPSSPSLILLPSPTNAYSKTNSTHYQELRRKNGIDFSDKFGQMNCKKLRADAKPQKYK